MATNPANSRIDAIQGLRGIAALLVVVTHAILTLIQRVHFDPGASELAFGFGELGVKTFFVISGFIMTTTMYRSFARPGAPIAFVWKRLIRIVPIYWLVTLIYAVKLSLTGNPARPDELLMSLLFIPYDHGQALQAPIYGLGWTLNYEMFFYGLFAVALLWPRRIGLACLLVAFVGLVMVRESGLLSGQPGPWLALSRYYTKPIILYFAGGVVLALVRKRLEARGRMPRIDTHWAVLVALAAAVLYGCFVERFPNSRDSLMAISAQVAACAISTIVCSLSMSSVDIGGRFYALLLALGNASYSIYLTHSFLMGGAGRAWARVAMGFNATAGAIVFVGLMVAAASVLGAISYRVIERPVLALLRRKIGAVHVASA